MATNIIYKLDFIGTYTYSAGTITNRYTFNIYYDDSLGIGVELYDETTAIAYGPYYYPDYLYSLPGGGSPPHVLVQYFPQIELAQIYDELTLYTLVYPQTRVLQITDYKYNFCDGGDRISFKLKKSGGRQGPSRGSVVDLTVPYAELVRTTNHFSCSVDGGGDPIVCDVAFNSTQTIVYPSQGNSDGSILVAATSSNGAVKYFINRDFDYATEGKFTAFFDDLPQGNYVIYARDPVSCVATKSIFLGNSTAYGLKYYFQFKRGKYKERNNWSGRVEILQRGYTGSSSLVDMADNAFSIDDHGENNEKFYPLVSKVATIRLMTTSYGQYSEFFTDDEFKYQVKYYKDNSSGGSSYTLDWVGYITPMAYSDTNQLLPAPVSIIATDGIGYLKDIELSDNLDAQIHYQINQMLLISIILKKIGNILPIRSAASKFEENMWQSSSDDPFIQTYVDGNSYTNDSETLSCHQVLMEILKPQGCRMYQSKGYWWIVPVVDQSEEFNYREFTIDAAYSSNGSYDGSKNVNLEHGNSTRLFWIEGAASREILPGYGKIILNNDLGLKSNTVLRNGSFENEVYFFKDWTISVIEGGGVIHGRESVVNGDSFGALFAEFTDISDTSTIIFQTSVDLSIDTIDTIKFKFDYLMKPFQNVPYVKMEWSLKSSIYYLKNDGTWSAQSTDEWQIIYNTSYNEFINKEIQSKPGTIGVSGTCVIRFKIYGQAPIDTSNLTTLAAVSTSSKPEGYKIRCADSPSGTTVVRYYELETDPSAEDSPNTIDPDDSAVKKWVLKNTYAYNSRQNQLKTFLLDNVRLEYYPDSREPDDIIVYSQLISKNVKNVLEDTLIHGDLPQGQFPLDTFLNGKRLFFSYLKLSDGTPTKRWKRSQKVTLRPILDHLKEEYVSQYPFGLERLRGKLMGDIDLSFGDTIIYNGNKYMIIALVSDETNGIFDAEMIQTVIGSGGVSVPQIGPFNKDHFSEAFNIG